MDKKELRQKYKETRRPMGIYRVHNIENGRSLIGRSVDLPASLNRERAQLRFGAHRVADLQRDWNELGPDAFVFEVLDTLSPPEDQPEYDPTDDLGVLETLWLERLEHSGERVYARRVGARS